MKSREARPPGRQLRRLRPALPFSVLTDANTVRLIAGEDFRYSMTAPEIERWLPQFIAKLDGKHDLEDALLALDPQQRQSAREITERLLSERVLVEAAAADVHVARKYTLKVEGGGVLFDALRVADASAEFYVRVLCQDNLDYAQALHFNRECLEGGVPWLWATCGPLSRGYVSPIFLPDAGPCLECLIGHFRRISPEPDVFAHLLSHSESGRPLASANFPARGIEILRELVRWKAELMGESDPPAALFRLHVLEVSTLEVSAHRAFADAECPACSRSAHG